MKDYKKLVQEVLEKHPATQDDDFKLYARVCWILSENKRNMGFYEALYHHEKYNLPSYESVTRARRKIQEEREDLRGKKYNDRKKRQEEYREHYQRGEDFVG